MKKRSLFAIALCCLTMTPHIHSAAEQEREVVLPVSLNGNGDDVEARENVAQEAHLSPRKKSRADIEERLVPGSELLWQKEFELANKAADALIVNAAANVAEKDAVEGEELEVKKGSLYVNQSHQDVFGPDLLFIRERRAEQKKQERDAAEKRGSEQSLSDRIADTTTQFANTAVYLAVDNTIKGAREIAHATAVKAREGAIGITHLAEQAASKATAFLEHQKNAWDQRYFTPRPDINGNGDDLPGAGDTIEIGYPAAFGLKSLAHPTQKQISLDDEKN